MKGRNSKLAWRWRSSCCPASIRSSIPLHPRHNLDSDWPIVPLQLLSEKVRYLGSELDSSRILPQPSILTTILPFAKYPRSLFSSRRQLYLHHPSATRLFMRPSTHELNRCGIPLRNLLLLSPSSLCLTLGRRIPSLLLRLLRPI